MNSAAPGIKHSSPLLRGHGFLLALLVGTLSVTVELKIFNIQYLEIVYMADFFLLLYLFAIHRLQVQIFRPFFSIAKSYGIFLLAAFLLAVIALRQEFYPFNDVLLKQPLIITFSRMVELFLDVFYMLY